MQQVEKFRILGYKFKQIGCTGKERKMFMAIIFGGAIAVILVGKLISGNTEAPKKVKRDRFLKPTVSISLLDTGL